jgi:predicted short-subunit dehydrogenase-like oxidoreductase (DUF2520 family)
MRQTAPMDVAVVGAGRVGTALAVLLRRAGYRIVGLAGGAGTPARAAAYLPGVPVVDGPAAARSAEVVLIGTPDAAISAACADLAAAGALGPGRLVGHLSGATGLDALAAARASGSSVFCLHPLQTCPTVDLALARLPGSGFAITAADDRVAAIAEALARDAGGVPFRLDDARKPAYHAAAVLTSNALVALTDLATRLLAASGVDDPARVLAPLERATVENLATMSAGDALTGPALRGDAPTVEGNLRALAEILPEAVVTYVVLTDRMLDLAARAGRIDDAARARVEEVLARWR